MENRASVGNTTQYKTNCVLQPGQLYYFEVVSNVSLTNPDEIMEVTSQRSGWLIMGMYLKYPIHSNGAFFDWIR